MLNLISNGCFSKLPRRSIFAVDHCQLQLQPHLVVVLCVQSQWLGAVQLGAGEDLPADRWNLQMRPGVPTHPPKGIFIYLFSFGSD